MDEKKAEKISKALADPNRLLILKKIKEKQDCLYCTDIYEVIDLTQPSISHHLKLLTDAELVIPKKDGRMITYTLNNKMLEQYAHFIRALMS